MGCRYDFDINAVCFVISAQQQLYMLFSGHAKEEAIRSININSILRRLSIPQRPRRSSTTLAPHSTLHARTPQRASWRALDTVLDGCNNTHRTTPTAASCAIIAGGAFASGVSYLF